MTDPFVHLRVASGYSLRYGASHPSTLVERAAEYDMDLLALTDRDGLYGAVRFAKACLRFGIGPVLGVDLAVPFMFPLLASPRRRRSPRTPSHGGTARDHRLPRVVVLAASRAGWASLCRLVSATHLAGPRGEPVGTPELITQYASAAELVIMLGADSELGVALAAGCPELAEQSLRRWREAVGPSLLAVAVTHHSTSTGTGSLGHAARMLALADRLAVPAVLTNMVRMSDRQLAPTVDVLDATRRLVPLDRRHVDQRNAEGYLKSGKEMAVLADEVARHAGRGPDGGVRLLAQTRSLALSCVLDPHRDLGLGETHLPELSLLSAGPRGSRRSEAGREAMIVLRQRCEAGIAARFGRPNRRVEERLAEELRVVDELGFASYFLTVVEVVEMIKQLKIRCAARGSGVSSLVNYLLGISSVDPLRHGLIMERFLSPLRKSLPDIDLDVESARRIEVYDAVLDRFGGERVACVAMLDTYRVRHAVRDAGAALSLPPGEIDAIAKAFPHIRASDARAALRDLPELRGMGLGERRLDLLFALVQSLDGLPRHIALHPCGILLSDATLLDRTPVEASFGGQPMSQFDKDDVEDLGLLKLDVLGIRMQSSMAHALAEIRRTTAVDVDLDALSLDDAETYALVKRGDTLGCFQVESPGQRELIGKFGPESFPDIIIDISLFRPGPVQSEMVTPFLEARHGWQPARYLHPALREHLAETSGVVVFHEQVIKIISTLTGCDLAEADEARRSLGDWEERDRVRDWLAARAHQRGFAPEAVGKVWEVLAAFASFGFCKAHAAAFALTTYQSAWLKTHYPAHFLAGVLTHDPGMYPKRMILEEVRRMHVPILGLDVNASTGSYRVEEVDRAPDGVVAGAGRFGIRLSLADVSGISETEIVRVVAGQPYTSLSDFWVRAQVSQPVAERLVEVGAFDALYGICVGRSVARREQVSRRDLLLAVADLRRDVRIAGVRARGLPRSAYLDRAPPPEARVAPGWAADPRDLARRQSEAPAQVPAQEVQLPLDFAAGEAELVASGLPELTDTERVKAELSVLGLDASRHVLGFYLPFLRTMGVSFSADLLSCRTDRELLVAGVKVATQTPPIRSGRRVVFLTLDDTTGPVDVTFFEDVQASYVSTVFSSWLLIVRGMLRRTGPRGVSLRATGCWELSLAYERWHRVGEQTADPQAALAAVRALMAVVPDGPEPRAEGGAPTGQPAGDAQRHSRAGGMGQRRVLLHPSGFRQSAYADVRPAGSPVTDSRSADPALPGEPPRKLWHCSQGSSGR